MHGGVGGGGESRAASRRGEGLPKVEVLLEDPQVHFWLFFSVWIYPPSHTPLRLETEMVCNIGIVKKSGGVQKQKVCGSEPFRRANVC